MCWYLVELGALTQQACQETDFADRFSFEIKFKRQLHWIIWQIWIRLCIWQPWFSLNFNGQVWIERVLLVAGSWLLSWCSLFCEWAWTSESILVITLLLTNLIKWFQVISTVTPFSIGVFTDNTEVLPSPHPLISTTIQLTDKQSTSSEKNLIWEMCRCQGRTISTEASD